MGPDRLLLVLSTLLDGAAEGDKAHIEWLYGALSVCDAKAVALLQANAIIMVLGVVTADRIHALPLGWQWPAYLAFFPGLAAVLIAVLQSFRVVRFRWGFLQFVKDRDAGGFDFAEECRRLAGTAIDRARYCDQSAWATIAAFALFGFSFVCVVLSGFAG